MWAVTTRGRVGATVATPTVAGVGALLTSQVRSVGAGSRGADRAHCGGGDALEEASQRVAGIAELKEYSNARKAVVPTPLTSLKAVHVRNV